MAPVAAEYRGASSDPCPSTLLQLLLRELPSTTGPRNLSLQGQMVVVGNGNGDGDGDGMGTGCGSERTGVGCEWGGHDVGIGWELGWGLDRVGKG